jgi:hypothetical protein
MATVYRLLNEKAKAAASFEDARVQAEATVKASPDGGPRQALLGLIYAGLGRCEEALAEGEPPSNYGPMRKMRSMSRSSP